MLQFYSSESSDYFTFDDVLLVPQYNEIRSRLDVDLTSGFHIKLSLPLISANMDTVTESEMAIAMDKAGGLGILHRFMKPEKLNAQVCKMREAKVKRLALSVGVNDKEEINRVTGYSPELVCIDVAHGHSKAVSETIERLRKELKPSTKIIAGNVATAEGVRFLAEAGADIIKVGIGPGSLCSTRVVTGHGVPQLSAIDSCAQEADILTAELGRVIEIIADGGIRNSGDAAKAIAAGADYVMVGSLVAASDEAPGDVVLIEGRKYKQYRGMASRDVQKELGKTAAAEGVSKLKPALGPVSEILAEFAGGLRSAFTYSGACDVVEFKQKAKFIRITSHSHVEGTPHGLLA